MKTSTFISIWIKTYCVLLIISIASSSELEKLRKYDILNDSITISGFSAGASMATQLHVSSSSLFHGVALFSQAFYRCGPNSLLHFGFQCSTTGLGIFPYDYRQSLRDVQLYESQGLIDSTQYLRNQRVFVWIGDQDEYIVKDMAVRNVDFYKEFVSNPETSIYLNVTRAKHLFPTTNFGDSCTNDASGHEYLGNCNWSGAYHALEFLLRDKTESFRKPEENHGLSSRLRKYNQSEFYKEGKSSISDVAMGTAGFFYVPLTCESSPCRLHLNFHGCNEWPPAVAQKYIEHSGFLPVADANDIILVFPLTTKVPKNMDGCWDFFSYTGSNFATKNGSQIKVARAIINRLVNGL